MLGTIFRFVLSAVCALSLTEAVAQTAVQDVETREANDITAREQPLSGPSVQFTSQRPPSNAEEIVFQLNGLEIAGGTAFDEATLNELYQGDLGVDVSLARIFEIAGEVQGLYRDADFIFTRVVVPAQEIDGGMVRIEIIEALITSVVVEEPDGSVGPVKALAERMVEPIVNVRNPTGGMLERALLNINEIPGITRATAVPQADPDDARGGLQLFVNIERDPWEGAIIGDNRQTEAIGRALVGASLRFNSYSEDGDTTSIAVFNSFAYKEDETASGAKDGALDFDERNTVQITHQRNVGTDGGTVQGVALFSRTRPGDNLADAGIEGEQILLALNGQYPIVRTREIQFNVGAGVEFFESETDVSNGALRVADDRLRVVRATADLVARDAFGYTRASATVRQGLDVLNATSNDALDRSRNDGVNDFSLIKGEIDRLVVINDTVSFFGKLSGQYAFDPLLASEEFAIGGLTYGRGLDPSVFTGDHGLGMSGEMRYLYPFSIEGYAITLEAFAFAEYGVIWNKLQGQPQRAEVLTLGGGVRFFFPEDVILGLEVASAAHLETSPAGGIPEGVETNEPRLFVNFSKRF